MKHPRPISPWPCPSRHVIAVIALLLLGLGHVPEVGAGPIWQRIVQSGEIKFAAEAELLPFSFRDGDGQLRGFSVDVAEAIRRSAEQKAGRPIKLTPFYLDFIDRLDQVGSSKVDLECSQVTPIWSRHARIDFSIPFMLSNYDMVIGGGLLRGWDGNLAGKRMAVQSGSYIAQVLQKKWPGLIAVEADGLAGAFRMVERGVDADLVIGSGVALRNMLRQSPRREALQLYTPNDPDLAEPIACMIPQNDSEWRRIVDLAIGGLFDGLDRHRGAYTEIYARWFGHSGMVHYPLDEVAIRFLVDNAVARGALP